MRTVPTACPVCGAQGGEVVARGPDFEYGTTGDELPMVRCLACDTFRLDPRPSVDELPRLYPAGYGPYHFNHRERTVMRAARNAIERRRAAELLDLAGDPARVLDVGCGDGRWLRLLREAAERRGTAVTLEGIEFEEDAAARAEREAGAVVHRGLLESVSLKAGAYDLIVLKDVIEHVADPAGALRTLRGLLRDGGRLFVETPNHRSRDWALFRDRYWGGYHFPRHFTVFHPGALARLCVAAGFEVEEIRYLPSPVFWTQSVHHGLAEAGRAGPAGFFSVGNPLPIGAFYVYDRLRLAAGRHTSKFEVTARA